jgi:Pyruvate/2-oxoacid:ferredoxin oxidoreductase delta subunit
MMVDDLHCNGCGVCLPACPVEAISLQNGKAFINEQLCKECEACVSVCPQGAILSVEVIAPEYSREVIPVAAPAQAAVTTQRPSPPALRETALPLFGAAVLWVGREIVPRLASLALDRFDRRIQKSSRDTQVENQQPLRPLAGRQNRGMGRGRQRQRRNRHKWG